jgi:hypothetical protein
MTTLEKVVGWSFVTHYPPPTSYSGIYQDSIPFGEGRATWRGDHLSDHLVADDAWIVHRDLSGDDLGVGDTVSHLLCADEDITARIWLGHVGQLQAARADHANCSQEGLLCSLWAMVGVVIQASAKAVL